MTPPSAAAGASPDGVPLIVMGASAGGVGALSRVVGALPVDLGAAVLVVLHVASDGYSVLPQILERAGRLPAHHATDGEAIAPGVVYVAPPDHHLLVDDGDLRLDPGPMENMARPSIDRLFVSAAEARGAGVVGVVLSGMLDDGTAGLVAIAEHGGVGVVQDPDDADFPGMPAGAPSATLIPATSCPCTRWPPSWSASSPLCPPPRSPRPTAARARRPRATPRRRGPGPAPDDLRPRADRIPSGLSCPGCGGNLWEEERGRRC